MVLPARVVVNVVDFQSLEADILHGMLPFLVSLKLIFAIFQAFDVAVDVRAGCSGRGTIVAVLFN